MGCSDDEGGSRCEQANMPQFEATKVVPDVLKKAPRHRAEVVYKESGVSANLGDELTPTQVKAMPHITFPAEDDALYTILMCDPDAGHVAQVHHFMVVDVKCGDSSTGTVQSEYIGPGPPQGAGLHRYTIAVFKQPEGWKPADDHRPKNWERRFHFNVQKYAEDNNFGDPWAGNFFRAQYDDWVPIQKAEIDAATPK